MAITATPCDTPGTSSAVLHPVDAASGNREAAVDEPLLLTDLLLPFARVRSLAISQSAQRRWADAFLLTAAAAQVLGDHLHRSGSWPRRIVSQLDGSPQPAVRRAGGVGHRALWAAGAVRSRLPRHRALVARRAELLELSVALAAATLGSLFVTADVLAAWVGEVLADGALWPSALEATALTVPSAFRSFDQHPRDMQALAHRLAEVHPDREQPVVVFGVRTSGSYLGPLLAAGLRREGFGDVRFGAIRPDDHLDRGQRDLVDSARGGLALVVDDPPVSGGSIAETADLLIAAGLAPDRVVLALALDDPEGLDLPVLAGRPRVTLPVEDWYLPSLIDPAVVQPTLQEFLGSAAEVVSVREIVWPGPAAPAAASTARRHHRRAAFAVDLVGPGGEPVVRTLLVESSGQGFYGRHGEAVARRLPGRTPETVGFAAGFHYQWLPPEVAPVGPGRADPAAVVDHLLARHTALAVDHDPSADFVGRQSVVEVATEVLSATLGPLGPVSRIRGLDDAVRRLLAVAEPSVVDGRVTLDRFLADADGALVKIDAAEGAFSHRDLATYDPVFDVAQLAESPIGTEVRGIWEQRTGRPIAPERWFLHRLVHRWDRRRHRQLDHEAARRVTSHALQDYLREVIVGTGHRPDASGPWVALDVDGVLEGPVLDASAPGRTGATALTALLRHGHRVVLATGRSAADVADRVRAWGLAGGVAEYGSVLVVPAAAAGPGPGSPPPVLVDLRTPNQRAVMAEVRAAVEAQAGLGVDPDHEHTVRAFRLDRAGHRVGLAPADVSAVLGVLADPASVTVVPGESQTDLVPSGCTKGTGMRALLERLDPGATRDPDRPLALAVGDGPADRSLLDLAVAPHLPHHAAALAVDGDTVTRAAYQAGLAEAVAFLLGHAPGACPTCRVVVDDDARFLLALLSLREAGPRGLPRRLLEVVTSAPRVGRRS